MTPFQLAFADSPQPLDAEPLRKRILYTGHLMGIEPRVCRTSGRFYHQDDHGRRWMLDGSGDVA